MASQKAPAGPTHFLKKKMLKGYYKTHWGPLVEINSLSLESPLSRKHKVKHSTTNSHKFSSFYRNSQGGQVPITALSFPGFLPIPLTLYQKPATLCYIKYKDSVHKNNIILPNNFLALTVVDFKTKRSLEVSFTILVAHSPLLKA